MRSRQSSGRARLLIQAPIYAMVTIGLCIGCGDNSAESESSTSGSGTDGTATVGAGGSSTTTGGAGTGAGGAGTTGSTGGGGAGGETSIGCSDDGAEIITLLNAYRQDNGLPAIPLSPSLCLVAQTHVVDLTDNAPDAAPECNLHSWSDQGSWSACCYTADHAQAQCMWVKPSELTDYPGTGYENAASGAASPTAALDLWKGSAGHNAVMLNQGIWQDYAWGAVGAALYEGHAALWFGVEPDPQP